MKALIYMRCSTDEDRQQVDTQLDKVRKYVLKEGWPFDIAREYSSAWNKPRPIFLKKIEEVKLGKYQIWICYDMDRFSRDDPHIADDYLNTIVHKSKCRFISLNDSIDSNDDVKWNIVRHIMVWQANKYSQRLSNRIKEGIKYYKKIEKKNNNTEIDRRISDLWKKENKTVKQIANELGIHTMQIHKVLGYQHGRRRKADYNAIRDLYKAGASISDIARNLGINKSSVWNAIRRQIK